MTIFVVLLIFLSFTSDGTSFKKESGFLVKNEVKAIEGDYRLTTMDNNYTNWCNQSNSCNGIDQAYLSIHDLRNRNCMCDEQCILYEDCCKDSKFQMNLSTRQNKFACVSTATDGFVYMIASCPTSWNQSQDIQENCHNLKDLLYTLDVWILTPVTAYQSGITYKNMFCAFCHGETNFYFWKIVLSCAPVDYLDKPEWENLLDPNDVLRQMSSDGTYSVFWQPPPKNTTYHCSWHGKSTNDTRLRYCLPRSEIICSSSTNCSNYKSYVHVDNNESASHQGKTNESSECYHPKLIRTEAAFVANISNPHVIEVPHCQQIPHNVAIFHKVCEMPEPANSKIEICFPKINCLIRQNFVINETITFLDNETVFIKDRGISYPSSEWLKLLNGSVYVCGSYIPPLSKFHQIVDVLDDWLSETLIKFSIACLLLHLFIFQQLPQMRNFSGKNLTFFCATLLVAFLCFEIGPKLPRCEITAVILHYSLLSCFTWSLLMSYDCWHTLRLATKELRSAGGKRTIRLYIYCIISWLIPGLIVSVALYFDLSSPETIPCAKKVGYGKLKECFIGSKYGLITFFVFPASCMFLGNICFFFFTSLMIYGNKKSSVNPNSKNDFLMYIRLALMMGLTWTTGTLVYLTENLLIRVLFSILNMSQGVLIFFAFTLKDNTLKLLLEKHKENTRVAHLLQIFIRDPVSDASTQMTNVGSSNSLNERTSSLPQVTLSST